MNKQLILKAVEAVIDFNAAKGVNLANIAIHADMILATVNFDWNETKYLGSYGGWMKSDLELEAFITKLGELSQ